MNESDKFETVRIESKVREGVFMKLLETWKVGKPFLVLVNAGVKETSPV